jgi:hypothetical protein
VVGVPQFVSECPHPGERRLVVEEDAELAGGHREAEGVTHFSRPRRRIDPRLAEDKVARSTV